MNSICPCPSVSPKTQSWVNFPPLSKNQWGTQPGSLWLTCTSPESNKSRSWQGKARHLVLMTHLTYLPSKSRYTSEHVLTTQPSWSGNIYAADMLWQNGERDDFHCDSDNVWNVHKWFKETTQQYPNASVVPTPRNHALLELLQP